jgi:hypothetical protein
MYKDQDGPALTDAPTFKAGDHVTIGGITALHGQTGVIRGTRGHGPDRMHFVYLDKRHWPAIAENGIWCVAAHLTRS